MTSAHDQDLQRERQMHVAAALAACAEALEITVTDEKRLVLLSMAYRYPAVDSVLHQVGAEEFGRMLDGLTQEVCLFLRTQASQTISA